MDRKTWQRWAPLVTVLVLVAALGLVRWWQQRGEPPAKAETQTGEAARQRGLNRNPAALRYSHHARCRMQCRKIDEAEVRQILQEGKINYRKSEIGQRPECDRKYALEGLTRDRQRVRIVFAPCNGQVTVVTVIDLDREWPCDCD